MKFIAGMPVFFTMICFLLSCNNKPVQPAAEAKEPVHSNNADTLMIDHMAAIFYSPDTFKLKQYEKSMEKGVFDAAIHEFGNQLRVSHLELAQQWPAIPIIEASGQRYLHFTRKDGKTITIDLDKHDIYGLYVFDPTRDPQSIDMMNAGTQLYYYFRPAE